MFSLLFTYIFTKSVPEKKPGVPCFILKKQNKDVEYLQYIPVTIIGKKKKKKSMNPILNVCQNNFPVSYKAVF